MKNIFVLLFLLTIAFKAVSQNETFPQQKKSIFIYTIDNISSQQQLDSLKLDIEKINGVSDVKTICKWETGKGQLIYTYNEIISGTENTENIDMSIVKKFILNRNLGFVDFKVK